MEQGVQEVKIRALLTDSNRENLIRMEKLLIKAMPKVRKVVVCHSAEEALEILKGEPFELLITTINLPEINGLQLIRKVNKDYSSTKCIAITRQENIESIQSVFNAGAKGYLLKDCSKRTLRNSIQRAMKGEYSVSGKIAHNLVLDLLKKTTHEDLQPLTSREKEIITSLAEGYRYKEIAHQKNLSYHTVHTHIKNIYKKLKKKDRRDAINLAKEIGLIESLTDESNKGGT